MSGFTQALEYFLPIIEIQSETGPIIKYLPGWFLPKRAPKMRQIDERVAHSGHAAVNKNLQKFSKREQLKRRKKWEIKNVWIVSTFSSLAR